jgi:hypothetical protein
MHSAASARPSGSLDRLGLGERRQIFARAVDVEALRLRLEIALGPCPRGQLARPRQRRLAEAALDVVPAQAEQRAAQHDQRELLDRRRGRPGPSAT